MLRLIPVAFLLLALTGAGMLYAGAVSGVHLAELAGVAMFGAGLGLALEELAR